MVVGCGQADVTPTATVSSSIASEPTPTQLPPTPVPDTPTPLPLEFNGDIALAHVAAQVALGPRYPGSEGHLQVREYMSDQLRELGWAVEWQEFEYQPNPNVDPFLAANLIGKANIGKGDTYIIIGAHYDTRARADQTFGAEDTPVIGAIDGGSGVGVLLELARVLDLDAIDSEVWLVFFDVEDNGSGGILHWDWIAGSQYMADNLDVLPSELVLVDMVGQDQQELYYDNNSSVPLREELWQIAAELGFADEFIQQTKYTIIDDHLPFAQRGVQAVDIIDFDYPYWHTTEDTLDKVSVASLEHVGRVVEVWLELHR